MHPARWHRHALHAMPLAMRALQLSAHQLARARTAAACVSTPGWHDSWGTCAAYARYKWCSANGTEGPGAPSPS